MAGPAPAAPRYLHGVHSDGQGRVIPVHLAVLARVLVAQGSLVRGADAEHAQDDHEHQEAHTHHNHHRGCAGHHCKHQTQLWSLALCQLPLPCHHLPGDVALHKDCVDIVTFHIITQRQFVYNHFKSQ